MVETSRRPVQLMLGENERLPKTVYRFPKGTYIYPPHSLGGALQDDLIADRLSKKIFGLTRYQARNSFTLWRGGTISNYEHFPSGTCFGAYAEKAKPISLK